ncbi:uncharacterized protein [Chironomus tepperi]|uniref:uncharacterized protein n=1 Tax=Chironomus tepperi TaxID=113505 RepID=UPI00391F54E2
MIEPEDKHFEMRKIENPIKIRIDNKNFDSESISAIRNVLKSLSTSSDILNIFTSNEDKSAAISLFIESHDQGHKSSFWTENVDLENVMRHYASSKYFNVKNFFSILMYDWFDPKNESNYGLCEKFEAFEKFGDSLMKKLLEIFDHNEYKPFYRACLKIIYQYLHEKTLELRTNAALSHENKAMIHESRETIQSDQEQFQTQLNKFINEALLIKNEEYKVKVLKVLIVYLQNSYNENYTNLKDKIMEAVHYNFKQYSCYEILIDSIVKYCDEKFFQLIFTMKENLVNNFEFGFGDLITNYKKFYGEYWEIAIKENVRLLHHAAINCCVDSESSVFVKLILDKCSFIELNSSILASFKEVDDFYVLFNGMLDDKEIKFLNDIYDTFDHEDPVEAFRKFLKDKKFTVKMLLGRRNVREMSLFENILFHSKFYPVLDDLWTKFKLGRRPELMMLKNPLGKYLIEYVILTRNINQLTSFMSLSSHQSKLTYSSPKHFMMFKNALVYSISGKSLFEYNLDTDFCEDLDPKLNFFEILAYLLEEIGSIDDIKPDVLIDNLMEKMTGNISNLDLLLGHMIAYWNPQSSHAQVYKKNLLRRCPFFDLLFMVIEGKSEEFEHEYLNKISHLEKTFTARYSDADLQNYKNDSFTSKFIAILLLAAIRTKQHKVIDCILANNSLSMSKFIFTKNMKVDQIHNYTALTLMKKNCQLGGDDFPKDWLTHDALIEFLDSRINCHDKELIEIDCSFMSRIERQKIKVTSKCDITDDFLINEDIKSFKYLEENEIDENISTHPVIKTIVAIKRQKYNSIYMYNFWTFQILFFFPFLWQLQHHYLGIKELDNTERSMLKNIWFCGLFYLICREMVQAFFAMTLKRHFWDKTNVIDSILIILSMALIAAYSGLLDDQARKFLEVSLVIVTSITLAADIPTSKSPLYMHIFKSVAATFLSLFYSFALILAAFALAFIIVFEHKHNPDVNTNTASNKNFENLYTSLTKVVTMLSGEYSIEPITLSPLQLLVFAIFVITSFILYNLILGLSIENINEVKEGSKGFILLREIRKIIGAATKLEKFYHGLMSLKIRLSHHSYLRPLQFTLVDIPFGIVKIFIAKYIFIHNISKVYINRRSGDVYVFNDNSYKSIFTGKSLSKKFKIDKNTLSEIRNIISTRNQNSFEELKKNL